MYLMRIPALDRPVPRERPSAMDFVMLDDPEFQDFNFLLGYDPALRPGGGPGHQELYQMVIQARSGDPVGALEFAGVMGPDVAAGGL
jgi:hypothetical protein